MRAIGYIVRNFLKQEPKFWFCFPEYVKTKKEKEKWKRKIRIFMEQNMKIESHE